MSSSMANIQETARWQFCRKTHFPFFSAARIIFSAIGPWPWPSEMDSTLRSRETNILWPCSHHGASWAIYQTPSLILPLLWTIPLSGLQTVACSATLPSLMSANPSSCIILPVKTTSFFRKALKGPHRVRSCAENEDQRRGRGHIAVEVSQVNWRIFYKLLPQADNHELCCCKHHLHNRGKSEWRRMELVCAWARWRSKDGVNIL